MFPYLREKVSGDLTYGLTSPHGSFPMSDKDPGGNDHGKSLLKTANLIIVKVRFTFFTWLEGKKTDTRFGKKREDNLIV